MGGVRAACQSVTAKKGVARSAMAGPATVTWPNTIPEDLRRILSGTLATRSVGPAEVWGDLRDWLIRHGVEPPAHPLPEYRPPERGADQ